MEAMTEEEAKLQKWNEVVDESIFTAAGIERAYDFCAGQVSRWLRGIVRPSKKSIERMEAVIVSINSKKRIPWHPSFGYATPEQIERLKKSIHPLERDAIMKQIDKQTKLGGKID